MSFIARRSGGVMWAANLAVLGAVLITPDLFDSLDKLAARSHLLPEIQIILDAVSQRCSAFPLGRASEPQHARSAPLSLETAHPSLGGAGGVVTRHINQPRLLHKDALSSNMQVLPALLDLFVLRSSFHFSFGYLLKPALGSYPEF
jgi:hypothetical protein